MSGLLAVLDSYGAPAYLQVRGGTIGAGPVLATIRLRKPCGTIGLDGRLALDVPTNGAYSSPAGSTPTWARLCDGGNRPMLDMRARLSSTPDDPEDPADVVVDAASLALGSFLRVSVGSIGLTT